MTQASVTDESRNAFREWKARCGLEPRSSILDGHEGSFRAGYEAALSNQPKAVSADISEDRNWIAGAQWGFGRGLENDNASLDEAIEARQRDIKAAKAIIGEGD